MTKTPKRKTSGLTQLVVNQVKAPPSGRIELWDTRGLHLRVSEKKKIWLLRYRFEGKQRRLELGIASGEKAMTLKDAQDKAAEKRADIKRGIDPAVVKKAAPVERSASTVKAVAEKYFEEYCARKQASGRKRKSSEPSSCTSSR